MKSWTVWLIEFIMIFVLMDSWLMIMYITMALTFMKGQSS